VTNLKVLELDDMIEHIVMINNGHLIMEDDMYNINSTISSTLDLGNSNNNSLIQQHDSMLTTTMATTTDDDEAMNAMNISHNQDYDDINDGNIINNHDNDNHDDGRNIEYMTDEDWKLTVNKRVVYRRNSHFYQPISVISTSLRHNPLRRVSTEAVLQCMMDNTTSQPQQHQQQHINQQQQHQKQQKQQPGQKQQQHHHHIQLSNIDEDFIQSSSTSISIGAYENHKSSMTSATTTATTTTTTASTTTTTNSNNIEASGFIVSKRALDGINPDIITLDELKSPTLIENRFKWATNNTNHNNNNNSSGSSVSKHHHHHHQLYLQQQQQLHGRSHEYDDVNIKNNSSIQKTSLPSGMW
jgi:hypothetical protein